MFVKKENHFSLLARKNGKEKVEKEGPGGVRNGKAEERERCLKKWERNEKPLIGG